MQGLSTEDWLSVARETLIKDGVNAVKIDRLAKACNVTRGGFYWRFKSREDLLDQLLQDWKRTNTTPIVDALMAEGTPQERYRSLINLWLEEGAYRSDYDVAVRNWAVASPKVAKVVHEADDLRIEALRKLFEDAGYSADEAFIRARITYFHQVGYYAMGLGESKRRRRELSSLYYQVLTGFPADTLFGKK
jgi:AcrR family transcriptional regulator